MAKSQKRTTLHTLKLVFNNKNCNY